MRILFLTKGYARYRKNLVEGLAEALGSEHQVLLAPNASVEQLWEVDWNALIENKGLVYYRAFPHVGVMSFFKLLFRRLADSNSLKGSLSSRIFEELNPDIVLIQEFSFPMLKVALACRLAGIPCVVCSDIGKQTNWSYGQFSTKAWWVHRLTSWLPTGLIAHTAAALDPIAAKGRPTCFIPHSIDLREVPFLGSSKRVGDKVKILMVAAYNERKGYDLLAKAICELKRRELPSFEFRLVGTENPKWVTAVMAAADVTEEVRILGVLKGEPLFDEFRAADLFVFTTRADTYAVVVHEAAGFGLPLIISKFAGAASVLVNEGVNGFVVDPNDTQVLADRLEQLIKDEKLREQFAKQSREIGLKYCASEMGENLGEWLIELWNVINNQTRRLRG